jgi:hypothetical protein
MGWNQGRLTGRTGGGTVHPRERDAQRIDSEKTLDRANIERRGDAIRQEGAHDGADRF